MARAPNYGQQRAERNRSKQARKEEKLREREAAAAARKLNPDGSFAEPQEGDPEPAPAHPAETPDGR